MKIFRRICSRKSVFILIVAGIFLIVGGILCFANTTKFLTIDSGEVHANVLIVPGGGLRERPLRAAELFKAGDAPLILCTGFGDVQQNEAVLLKSGVPAAAILIESKSRTTRENAKFTDAILHERHITNAIIVTSWYHSRRALHTFEHYAPDIKFYSRPSYFGYQVTDKNRKYVRNYIRSEYVKLLGYWVCYGVCPF